MVNPTLLDKRDNQFLPKLQALPITNASSYRLLQLEYCTILLGKLVSQLRNGVNYY